MQNKPHIKVRNLLTLLGLTGLCIIILFNRHQFESFWHLLSSLRWYIVVLVVAVQVASYWVNALYYRSILKIFTYNVGIRRLFEGALATNYVNYIVPTVGLAGAGYLSQVLSPKVPRGVSVLTQLMRYAFSGVAVLVMMPVGFLLIFLSGDAQRPIVKATLLSAAGIMTLAIGIIVLIQHESTLQRLLAWIMHLVKRVYPEFAGEKRVAHFISEFYTGYRAMTSKKRRLSEPFGWSIVYILIEILTFYLAFLAFGRYINPGIVIMAYLFANIVSIFGGIFFSIGVFELGMVGTLVALGVPFALAFSVTAIYRVLNLLIGLPPGFYYYKKYLP